MLQMTKEPKPRNILAENPLPAGRTDTNGVLNDLGVMGRHRATPGARLPFGHGEVVVDQAGGDFRLIIN